MKIIAQDEDKDAFKELFQRYYAKLMEFAIYYVKDTDYAKDIISEVFLKLYKGRRNFNKINNLEGYLFLTVKNHCLNFLEKNHRWFKFSFINHPGDLIYTDQHNPEKELLDSELVDLINKCISKMPPKRKLIFHMIKENGLKYKEVAEMLNISVNTVENHLDLAIKFLRIALSEYLLEKEPKKYNKDKLPLDKLLNLIF